MKRLMSGLCVVLVAAASFTACTEPQANQPATSSSSAELTSQPPSAASVAVANDVADAMVDRIVALLFREFAVTTPENAAVGSEAISNVFHDRNDTMRLVGDVEPLQATNYPQDQFEQDALAAAKLGNNYTSTERVNGRWMVRKSIAVSNAFSPTCVHCHSNFNGLTNPWVGALMVRAEVR